MDRETQTQTPRLWLLRKARSPFYQFNHSVYLFISLHKHLKDFKESGWICCKKQDKPHMQRCIQTTARTHTRAHLVKPIQTSVCLFPCPKRNNAITALAHMNSFTPSAQLFLLIKRLASGTEGENSEGFKTEEKEREWGRDFLRKVLYLSFSKSYIQVHIVCAKSIQTLTGLNELSFMLLGVGGKKLIQQSIAIFCLWYCAYARTPNINILLNKFKYSGNTTNSSHPHPEMMLVEQTYIKLTHMKNNAIIQSKQIDLLM